MHVLVGSRSLVCKSGADFTGRRSLVGPLGSLVVAAGGGSVLTCVVVPLMAATAVAVATANDRLTGDKLAKSLSYGSS